MGLTLLLLFWLDVVGFGSLGEEEHLVELILLKYLNIFEENIKSDRELFI